MFDIVIPVGPNDIDIISKQIEFTKKNIIGYRNIYLIYINNSLNLDGCITILESTFPFSIKTVADCHYKCDRNGWYLQQLFKLYAGFVIPDILDRYLVVDSDTFFLKPTTFINNDKCLYNYGTEYFIDYFNHISKIYPELKKIYSNKSGITHHMIFETKYIKELFDIIENKHNDLFYNIFLKNVVKKCYTTSGASEYELYFNYMFYKHPDKVELRHLDFDNVNNLSSINNNSNNLVYISYHHYRR
jgi:hypothetical protein